MSAASRPVLLDSNIVIDRLRSIPEAEQVFSTHADIAVSMITVVEVLGGAKSEAGERRARELLASVAIVPLDLAVADLAAALRRSERLSSPTPSSSRRLAAKAASC